MIRFILIFGIGCKKGTSVAQRLQIGETRKKRLAKRLAFFRFDYSFGV